MLNIQEFIQDLINEGVDPKIANKQAREEIAKRKNVYKETPDYGNNFREKQQIYSR